MAILTPQDLCNIILDTGGPPGGLYPVEFKTNIQPGREKNRREERRIGEGRESRIGRRQTEKAEAGTC